MRSSSHCSVPMNVLLNRHDMCCYYCHCCNVHECATETGGAGGGIGVLYHVVVQPLLLTEIHLDMSLPPLVQQVGLVEAMGEELGKAARDVSRPRLQSLLELAVRMSSVAQVGGGVAASALFTLSPAFSVAVYSSLFGSVARGARFC